MKTLDEDDDGDDDDDDDEDEDEDDEDDDDDDEDDDDDDDDGCHLFLNSLSKRLGNLFLQQQKNLQKKITEEDANRHELTKVKKSTGLRSPETLLKTACSPGW